MMNAQDRKKVLLALVALAAGRGTAAAQSESGLSLDYVTMIDTVRGFTRTTDINADVAALYATVAAVTGFNTPEANAKQVLTDLLNAWPTLGVPAAPRSDTELAEALRRGGVAVQGALKTGLLHLADLGRQPEAEALAALSGQPMDLAGYFALKFRAEYDQHRAMLRWWRDIVRNDPKKGPDQQRRIMVVLQQDAANSIADTDLAAKIRKIVPGVDDAWIDSLRHMRDHGRLDVAMQMPVSRRDRVRWMGWAGITGIAAALLLSFFLGLWRDGILRRANEQLQAGLTVVQAEKGAAEKRATDAEKALGEAKKATSDAEKALAGKDTEIGNLGQKIRDLETRIATADAARKAAEADRQRILADAAKGAIDANPAVQALLKSKDDQIAQMTTELDGLRQQLAAANVASSPSSIPTAKGAKTVADIGIELWNAVPTATQQDLIAKFAPAVRQDTSVDRAALSTYLSALPAALTAAGVTDNWWYSKCTVVTKVTQPTHEQALAFRNQVMDQFHLQVKARAVSQLARR